MNQIRRPATSRDYRLTDTLFPPTVVQAEVLPVVLLRQPLGNPVVVLESSGVSGACQWYAAGVDVDCAGAVSQYVCRNRFCGQRLAGNGDWLKCGFKGGTPTLPLACVVGTLTAAYQLVLSYVVSARTVSVHKPYATSGFSVKLHPRRFVNCLTHVQTFRKTRPVHPGNHVSNLKPGVLNVDRHAVLRPGAGERQEVPTRFQDAQALFPNIDTGDGVIPMVVHEGQAVRWVCHNAVNRIVRHEH